MSTHNNNSLLIKAVSQSNRFLSNNLNGIGMSSNSNRKIPKPMGNYSSSSISVNSYNYSGSTQSQSYLPSMIKNMPNSNANKKFSTDYQQAVRFDYADAFLNYNNIEFLNRITQMQRLQMETVDWERKKRISKKKSNNSTQALKPNNSVSSSNPNNSEANFLMNSANLNINSND